ncbi:MAG: hypothetical protein JSR91_00375 [Proteobacteria bacterium]|nr:hypothetical protein [Pseudomonadota bacterium]
MGNKIIHASDCALHNEPYKPNGPCDCGARAPRSALECAEIIRGADYGMVDEDDARLVAGAYIDMMEENQRLKERLEMAHVWQMIDGKMTRVPVPEDETIPDGIECREETIKLQDQHIRELQAEVKRLRSAMEAIGV